MRLQASRLKLHRPVSEVAATLLEDPAAAQAAKHALRGNRGGSKSDLHTPSLDNNMARFMAGIEMDTPETIAIYPQLPRVAASNHFAFSSEEAGCLWLSALRLRLPFSLMTPPNISYMPSEHLTVTIKQVGHDRAVLRVIKVVVWEGWGLGQSPYHRASTSYPVSRFMWG